jgi:hypothetical protein
MVAIKQMPSPETLCAKRLFNGQYRNRKADFCGKAAFEAAGTKHHFRDSCAPAQN